MARFNPDRDATATFEAASAWAQECLLRDGSIFSNEQLWTKGNVGELLRAYVDNPDLSKGKLFLPKLKLQLATAPLAAAKLMAEMIWIKTLFQWPLSPPKKRGDIADVWRLSGEELPDGSSYLLDDVLAGLGNPGVAYNTQGWRELSYLVKLVSNFKELKLDERAEVLSDPWKFAAWVGSVPRTGPRQFRHIIKHLLFPDTFERITTDGDKQAIIATFDGTDAGQLESWDDVDIDKALLEVRNRIGGEDEPGFDFYQPKTEAQWKPKGKVPSPSQPVTGPRVWIEKTLVQGRADRLEGPNRLGSVLWSPQRSSSGADIYANMTKVTPGDVVLHLTDNSAITGASIVAGPVDTTFEGVEGSTWGKQPSYRVPLRQYAEVKPPLDREELFENEATAGQLRDIAEDYRDLFYTGQQLRQGAYLTEVPPPLLRLLADAYQRTTGKDLPYIHIGFSPAPLNGGGKMTHGNALPMPTNLILYGPPGTGKTYATAEEAVMLCDGTVPVGGRVALMARYRELAARKRIEFVTFHQSFSYEDFVEGLRPETGVTQGTEGDSETGFRLVPRPGVFRSIADRAAANRGGKTEVPRDLENRQAFKMSLGNTSNDEDAYLFDECIRGEYVLLGHGGEIDWSDPVYESFDAIKNRWREVQPNATGSNPNIQQIYALRSWMKLNDIVIVSDGNKRFRAIGEVAGPYRYAEREHDTYHHQRDVRWLWVEHDGLPREEIYDKGFSQVSIYRLDLSHLNWPALAQIVSGGGDQFASGLPEPYVLIIDEINRANVSKVLGEAITLLEPDKRLGMENALTVTLPYSGNSFGVPANLHIIGTMNTADRSIALLDTALRRRFRFKELMPDASLLEENIDGINVRAALMGLNARLEYLFDRDHQVGHAYFMACTSRVELEIVLRDKVIPLLAEYFYENWEKVRAALNETENEGAFISRTPIAAPQTTPDKWDAESERWRYTVNAAFSPEAFAQLA